MAAAGLGSLLLCPPAISSFSHRHLPPSASIPSTSTPLFFPTVRRRHLRSLARPPAVVCAIVKLSDAELVTVPSDLEGFKRVNIPTGAGVYGVYNSEGALQFLGISRNIAGSIVNHKKALPDLCRFVKVGLIDESAPDRNVLTETWKSWMQEHIDSTGQIPPGNETGNTTWQRPQQRKKPDLRLTPGRHVQLTVPLEELIDKLVKENNVVAFIKGSRSAPQCGFSQRVVGILESHGVDYESVDVLDEEHNYSLREKLKQYSNWPTFPQVFFKGELLGGCDILTDMAEKGEIAKLVDS